jgi:hypothetical protein
MGNNGTIKLRAGEAERIAAYLARVVPKSLDEQAELLAFVKRLQGGRP